MSTSYSRAPEKPAEQEIRPFPYADAAGGRPATAGSAAGVASDLVDSADESARREAAAREAGIREGELRARAAYEEHLERVRENLRVALAGFARERESYYHRVELEVVQLALSIARKVLHREAYMDPLLLAALVRVALDKIETRTKVIVRVNPQQAPDCRAFFARCMDPEEMPEVLEDPAVELDQSVLQTELGTAEIGIEPQLKEIELGLMDLLSQRPQAT